MAPSSAGWCCRGCCSSRWWCGRGSTGAPPVAQASGSPPHGGGRTSCSSSWFSPSWRSPSSACSFEGPTGRSTGRGKRGRRFRRGSDMEKRTNSPYPGWDRPLLGVVGLVLVVSTVIFAWADRVHDWRDYQSEFRGLVAEKFGADKAATVPGGIQQIWVSALRRADRCTTCHQ